MNSTRFAVLGILGVATVLVMTVVAGAAFFSQHHRSENASPQLAEMEFQRLRARFAGQHPLLDMGARRPTVAGDPSRADSRLHSFHTVIFDTRGGERLVRITVPYRFARLFARATGFRWLGELTFLDDTEFDLEPILLSLDQIERRGPGLVVDYRHASGGQFVAWVE